MALMGEQQVMNNEWMPSEGAQGIKKFFLEHIPCHINKYYWNIFMPHEFSVSSMPSGL
jgi:hypothetical protein